MDDCPLWDRCRGRDLGQDRGRRLEIADHPLPAVGGLGRIAASLPAIDIDPQSRIHRQRLLTLNAAGEPLRFVSGGFHRVAAGGKLLVVTVADKPVAHAPIVVGAEVAPRPA